MSIVGFPFRVSKMSLPVCQPSFPKVQTCSMPGKCLQTTYT
jgi:hypothetical protein